MPRFDLRNILSGFIQPMAESAIASRVHVPRGDLPSVAESAAEYMAQDNPNLDPAALAQVVALLNDVTFGPAIAGAMDKAVIDYTLHRAFQAAADTLPSTPL